MNDISNSELLVLLKEHISNTAEGYNKKKVLDWVEQERYVQIHLFNCPIHHSKTVHLYKDEPNKLELLLSKNKINENILHKNLEKLDKIKTLINSMEEFIYVM